MPDPTKQRNEEDAAGPPIFRTWNQLYAAVILNLIVLICLFYIFTGLFD